MKKILVILLMTIFAANVRSQSLNDYLSEAAENNPQLRALFNGYLAALEKVPQVGSLPDPQLTFGFFTKPMEFPMGNQRAELTLMQMFPWFGMLRNQKDEASQMANARYQVFLEEKNQLFYQVKETWHELYRLEAEIKLMDETVEILSSLERLALNRFRSGDQGSSPNPTSSRNMGSSDNNNRGSSGTGGMGNMGSQQADQGTNRPRSSGGMESMSSGSMGSGGGMVDVLRAQMEIKEMQNQLLGLEDSRKPLAARFNRLLNRPANELVQSADTLMIGKLPMDQLAMLDSMMNNNPMVKMYDAEMKAFEAQGEMSRRERFPMIGAGVNYMIFSPRNEGEMSMGGDNMLMPMISISIPINRKRYRSMEKEAGLLLEAARYEQVGVKNQLSVQWDEAIRDLNDAERRVQLYLDQEKLAAQTLRLITTSYRAEGAAFEEVLSVQRQLLDFRMKLIDATVDQNLSIARIEMLAAININ